MNRSTVILIAVLLVLGGITYFLLPSETERDISDKPAQISFAIDSATIMKIELHRPSTLVRLENVGGKWMVTSPIRYAADPTAVTQLIAGIAKFKPGSLISSNPEKQHVFQVDSMGTRLMAIDRAGNFIGVIIGKVGPSFSEVYFRLPDSKDVYLGEGIDNWVVNKDVDDWREKNITSLPSESLKEVTYSIGAKAYDLKRDSSGWKMADQSVESGMMTATVNTLSNLRAEGFDDTMTTIPGRPVTVTMKGPGNLTLNIGPKLPDSSTYYVQSSSSSQMFLINKWTAEQLLKPIEKHIKPERTSHQLAAVPKEETEPKKVEAPPKKEIAVPETIVKKEESPAVEPTPNAPPLVTKRPRRVPVKKIVPPPEQQAETTVKTEPQPVPKTVEIPQPETKTTPAQPFTSTDEDGDLIVHTVKKGETMQTIAKKYNVSVERILKWNLLKSIVVKPGQELYVYEKK